MQPSNTDKDSTRAKSSAAPDIAKLDARTRVYFDGACALCSAEIRHYATRPGADCLEFVDVSAAGADLGPELDQRSAQRRFHVRRTDGQLVSGAQAFVTIWTVLPGWRWAARIARVPGVTTLLEGAYRAFLPIRPLLSRAARAFGATAANPDAPKH